MHCICNETYEAAADEVKSTCRIQQALQRPMQQCAERMEPGQALPQRGLTDRRA